MFPIRKEHFTAYVVFTGADHSIWWRLFTRRGLRHVQLIIPANQSASLFAKDGRSIVVNALSFTVSVSVVDRPALDLARECLGHGATLVLSYPVRKVFSREFVPRGILTCVSLLKAIMGINAFTVVTPEQLARWLIRNGAKRVFKDGYDGSTD